MGIFSKLFGKGPDETGKLAVEELARRMGVMVEQVRGVKVEYREVRIKKRHGGERVLQVPGEELKKMQRRILRGVLGRLAAHEAAMGFERGRSIVRNAAAHVGKAVVVKMDIKEFFPATDGRRVEKYFEAIGWNREAAKLLTHLTTHKNGLPQGAPTSPRLSNLVNYLMDKRLAGAATKLGMAYTRYADDMTFSWGQSKAQMDGGTEAVREKRKAIARDGERRVVALVIRATKEIVKEYGYVLHQNKKLRVVRRHARQVVTGLVVNEKVDVPRAMRRKLRAVEHHLKNNKPATMTLEEFAGWVNFRAMVMEQRA